jgi:hypothetical protein
MRRRWLFIGALALGLILVLAVGVIQAQESEPFSPSNTFFQPQQQCSDMYEPNESFGNAWFLSSGVITSYICCDTTDDYDYFKFSVDAGDSISLTLYNLPADYNLCLFDPFKSQIACSDNSGVTAEIITGTASSSGDHYALVYGMQGACDSDNAYTFEVQVTEPKLPDLIITDVWEEGGDICYQIMNAGAEAASAGHYTALSIDSQAQAPDQVDHSLAAGERLNRCFGSGWQCSWPDDTIEVCADIQGSVVESDETNNCTQETWPCDTTPPKITSGPVVSDVLQTSVVISWTTDEDSDSVVKYGRYAGKYEDQKSDPTPSKDHQVPLKDLEPATVYRYVVESADASGNAVASKERFFETAATPTGEPPGIAHPTVTRVEGARELYRITVPVSDTSGIGRVEFYLDGRLIGTDYSAALSPKSSLRAAPTKIVTDGTYTAYLAPSVLKLSRASFFATQHTVMAKAFGWSGLAKGNFVSFLPGFEFADINLQVWPNYHPTLYVDGVGGTLPAGTTVEVSVRASEDEWKCVGAFGMCGEVEHAVERVEFEVDGVLVYTSYPSDDDDFDHFYSWDVSGLGVGTYHIRVRAYAADGGSLLSSRTLTVEPGEPSLDVTRSVSQLGHRFLVELTVENNGTASFYMDKIEDNVTGFQPVIKDATDYDVTGDCASSAETCDVEIDFLTPTGGETVTLSPGASETVNYLAMPVLYPEAGAFGYGIGEDEVRVLDESGTVEDLLRPGDRTEDGLLLPAAVEQARRECDYLIVTKPARLFALYPDDDVNALLSAMAWLAEGKSGMLGYITGGGFGDAPAVREVIGTWGSDMMGSDGALENYMSNGYLLIVGEVEIMPASTFIDFDVVDATSHWSSGPVETIPLSDNGYANTSGNLRPELIVGRLIGDSAEQLLTQIQTSFGNLFWRTGATDALVASGIGGGESSFEANADRVAGILDDEFTVDQMYGSDYATDAARLADFRVLAVDKDILFYRDHGNTNCWSHTVCAGNFPVNFGTGNPFAFGSACSTGNYEDADDYSIAEAFMDQGAGVYIGSTERSARDANNTAGRAFFDRWVDSTKSLGQVLKETKRALDASNDYHRLWIFEYNLYGDPKYGDLYLPAMSRAVRSLAPQAASSLEVVIPQYETITSGGLDYVDIPGPGGQLLLAPDEPRVPIYVTSTLYADGYEVQDVDLVARSGLITATGLTLPTVSVAPDGDKGERLEKAEATSTGWYPEQEYDWSVTDNPDGSSTLFVTIYAFYYNTATTDVKFYQNYGFDIEVVSSTVAIDALATDKHAYSQGDEVLVDLSLGNTGDALDVIVDAVVKTPMGDVADGLLLQSLKGLSGTASFSAQWDSTGYEHGDYFVEAEVRDSVGNVLDRKMEQFRLGIYAGEIITFTAGPTRFDVGDTIDVALVFSNTGTVPLTGTAIIRVQDDEGEVVESFSHAVANLAAAESIRFDDAWDTSGAEEGAFTVIGYVLYDSRATSIETVVVSTETYIYLPLVMRSFSP